MDTKISWGNAVSTRSGRMTSPAPRGPSSTTDRAVSNALRRLHKWLHAEALLESAGNDYLQNFVRRMDPSHLSRADIDILNRILWDQP